jgi:hypothetical protein
VAKFGNISRCQIWPQARSTECRIGDPEAPPAPHGGHAVTNRISGGDDTLLWYAMPFVAN